MSGSDVMLDADVVVVGAGMSGLYALKVLRDQGLRTIVLEKGSGVGGTWFWNRYPGARCDIPSLEYSFGFDPDLEQEWVWTEHFASQPEIERYLNHLADRYDLRRDIRLSTGVSAMTFDEDTDIWTFDTDTGERFRARFAVMATGGLSAPNRPSWPGIDTFEGRIVQTSLWPAEPVELEGQRIGIVGTGSSGVQAIPELARVARHLTVFQRTAAFTWPSRNQPLTDDHQSRIKARYRELRQEQHASFSGTAGTTGSVIFAFPTDERRILESTPEEREAALEQHGFSACRVWTDTATDLEANEMAVELFREMVRRTVKDPDVAESLSPRGYPLGCKRPVLDSSYFEAFNRDNVTLVDLSKDPIEEVTPTGIRTEQRFVELDLLVLATGFDAMTGALTRIDVRGRGGRLLPRGLGRRTTDVPRCRHRGLPEPLHLRRARQPRGPGDVSAADRAPARLDRRLSPPHRGPRVHTGRGRPRCAGRVVRARECGRAGNDVHRGLVQLLVQRRQHRGQGSRVPPVRRRTAQVHGPLQRSCRARLRRIRAQLIMSSGLLAEKVLMVTGAGRSLGAVIAEACVGEGATVIATDITGDDDGAVVRHDVTRADDWTRIVDDAVSAHGRLDGLVNNAAVILEARPFLEESPEEFARLLDVNVMGVWLGMQSAGRAMTATGGGAIVNISSTAGMVAHPRLRATGPASGRCAA